jgi:DNA invertase Pin-like site-specific DNA recombinase
MKQKYLIYCRVSTQQQEGGTSLDSQEKACRALIEERGSECAGVLSEVVSGGLYLARSELQKGIAAIESKQVKGLVMFDLARFARHAAYQEIAFERIERAGGEVLFVHDQFEKSPAGKMQRQIHGIVTQYYREYQAVLSREGLYNRAISGIMPSRSRAPFSYCFDDQNRYQVVKPLVRHARSMFEKIVEGVSTPALADYLNNKKVPTVCGAAWSPGTVWSVLANPVYKGEAIYGQYVRLTDDSRVAAGKSHAYRVLRPREEWIIIPAPSIVSAALWDKCQKVLQSRGGRPRR